MLAQHIRTPTPLKKQLKLQKHRKVELYIHPDKILTFYDAAGFLILKKKDTTSQARYAGKMIFEC